MLLRIRISLPDRPGSLGQVARTLGVAGADIVQVTVLERLAGRAVDDFTVSWPTGAPLDRLRAGLAASVGVQVVGLWPATGTPVFGGWDAGLLRQIATNPRDGVATLVDAAPGLLAADWAAVLVVPADWAQRSGLGPSAAVAYASWQTPDPFEAADVLPLRPRALSGPDGTRYAAVPFGRAGLVLLVARTTRPNAQWVPPAFHATELDRIAQLVHAATEILGGWLDLVSAPQAAPQEIGAPQGSAS